MTLLIAVPVGALRGLAFGLRTWVLVLAGTVWYGCLAVQTAYLAHPGRAGFLGADALPAVQGADFGQYWLAQLVIAALMVGLLAGASRLRRSSWSPLFFVARIRTTAPQGEPARSGATSGSSRAAQGAERGPS